MPGGPQPLTRPQRRKLIAQITRRLQKRYGPDLLALGVYGSVAREEDGPYSDIEMHCLLRGSGIDTSFEWSAGPWKAEVDVYSWDIIRLKAAQVDVDWALTQRAYTQVLVIDDPQGLFEQLKELVFSQPETAFLAALHDLVVGEIYELVGKVRNCRVSRMKTPLAWYATELTVRGALLIGLAQRHLFRSSAHIFSESLELPDQPMNFSELCRKVMVGDLSDAESIFQAIEAFWNGVEAWAYEHGITITAHPVIPI